MKTSLNLSLIVNKITKGTIYNEDVSKGISAIKLIFVYSCSNR